MTTFYLVFNFVCLLPISFVAFHFILLFFVWSMYFIFNALFCRLLLLFLNLWSKTKSKSNDNNNNKINSQGRLSLSVRAFNFIMLCVRLFFFIHLFIHSFTFFDQIVEPFHRYYLLKKIEIIESKVCGSIQFIYTECIDQSQTLCMTYCCDIFCVVVSNTKLKVKCLNACVIVYYILSNWFQDIAHYQHMTLRTIMNGKWKRCVVVEKSKL